MAAASNTSVSFVSLILSLILPFTMLAAVLNVDAQALTAPVDAQVESTLTVAEDTLELTAALKNTHEEGLDALVQLTLNGMRQGLNYSEGQLSVLKGDAALTLEEYEQAVHAGRVTTVSYENLVLAQTLLTYASDGRLQADLERLLPWLQSQKLELNKLFGVESAVLKDGNIHYAFTINTRDLSAAMINAALRVLSDYYNREMINNLHVWELLGDRPENVAIALYKSVTGSRLTFDQTGVIEIPVEIVCAPDGNVIKASAMLEVGEGRGRSDMELNYENNCLTITERSYNGYDEVSRLLELNVCAGEEGGMVDWNAQNGDENVHFFVNYQLRNGMLRQLDAQYVSTILDCTASLTLHRNGLNVTYYTQDGRSQTVDLNWVETSEHVLYWADMMQLDMSNGVDRRMNLQGMVEWNEGEWSHQVAAHWGTLEETDFSAVFTQHIALNDTTVTHDLTGSIICPDETSVPVAWHTTLTLN